MPSFKEKHSLQKRKSESERIQIKHPNRIAVIVEAPEELQLNKCKYLVPYELTMGQLQHIIRKRMKTLKPEQALFLFCRKTIPATNSLMSQIASENRDEDGFLYFQAARESTFG